MTNTAEDSIDVETEPAGAEPSRWPRVLVAIATLIAILATLSVWVRTQALDTDEWGDLSQDLIEEPQIREAVAEYLVNELYDRVDVTSEVRGLLPDNTKDLAGLVAAGLREPATQVVDRLLSSQQFKTLWVAAIERAHRVAVAILRDETPSGVSAGGGSVTVELGELVVAAGTKVGLSTDFLDRLPEDAGQIVVFESDEIESAQLAVRVLEFLAWFLFVLVVALYALAVYLAAGDRRRTTLRSVGWGLVTAGVVVLIARRVAISLLMESIVADPAKRPLAEVSAYVTSALLREMAWSALIYGLLIAVFAMVLGERRWATATRRVMAPLLNASIGAVVAGTGVLLLLLVWWSPGRAFRGWTTGLTLVALVIGAVIVLRRKTTQEFPDQTFHGLVESGQARLGSRSSRPTRSASRDGDSITDQIEALQALHDKGTLTDEEFVSAKSQLLG